MEGSEEEKGEERIWKKDNKIDDEEGKRKRPMKASAKKTAGHREIERVRETEMEREEKERER